MSRDVPFLVVLQTNCSINWASPYLQAFALLCSAWDSLGPRNNHKYTNLCNWVALFLPPPPSSSLFLFARSGACPFAFPCKCARGARANEESSSSSPVAPFPEVIQRTCNRYLWLCGTIGCPRLRLGLATSQTRLDPAAALYGKVCPCLSGRGLKRRPHIASWVTDCPQIEQQINTIPNWRLAPKTVNYLRPSKTHTHRDRAIKTSEFRDQIYL